MSRLAVAAALAALLLLVVACDRPRQGDRTEVRIGDRAWDVLLAGPDGMRRMADFGGADGMLFDFHEEVDPNAVVFVMDGVRFPLDIAWFSEEGEPVGTASMAVCPAEPCPRYAATEPYRWAVEAPPGAFDDLGPGDRLVVTP